jgi:hypothetical protein
MVVSCVTLALLLSSCDEPMQEYRTFESPDRMYRAIIYRKPLKGMVMPGQAGDAPGVVRVFDYKGKQIGQVRVAMVSAVATIEWFPRKVLIPPNTFIDLPSP